MSLYLHILADFDENGLQSQIYTSLDDFVAEKSEQFSLYTELEEYIKECVDSGEEPEYVEKNLYELIHNGSVEGEWDAEEFHEIKGTITEGIV